MVDTISNSVFSASDRTELNRSARITLMLLALNVMAVYYYGARAAIVSGIAVLASLVTEYILAVLSKKSPRLCDIYFLSDGLLLALLLPASVPYRIVVFSSVFMSGVLRFAFGGNKNLIFSPPAAAFAFSAITWPQNVLRYPSPEPFGSLSLVSDLPQVLEHSFSYNTDISTSYTGLLEIIWGRLRGPMGTGCVLIIIICAVSLYFFKDIPASVLFSGTAVNMFLFVLFPFSQTGWMAALYSLVTGSFMYILVFLACDPRLAPKLPMAGVLYGGLLAGLSFIFRKLLMLESSGVFALLIVELFASELERLSAVAGSAWERLLQRIKRGAVDAFIYIKFRTGREDTRLEELSWGPRENASEKSVDGANEASLDSADGASLDSDLEKPRKDASGKASGGGASS